MQFYEVFARKEIFVSVFCLALFSGLCAQDESQRARAVFEFGYHFLSFKGDEVSSSLRAASSMHRLASGVQFKNFTLLGGYNYADLQISSNTRRETNNFRAFFSGLDAQVRYSFFSTSEVKPFLQTGFGYAQFSTFGDRYDAQNRMYFSWSDGSLRNMPESDPNADAATLLERDYTYETRLNAGQSTFYIPVSLGLQMQINPSLVLFTALQANFLQSDNLDNSTLQSGWDQFRSLQLGICFSPNRRVKKVNSPKELVVDTKRFDGVDFDALFQSDEDGDGVIDYYDRCLGTTKGAPVDAVGCTPDSDGDGFVDFIDSEPGSPLNAKVDARGRAYSDEEIQEQYNDSIGLFVQVLRKVHKGSRPYPVRKFIPIENLRLYEALEAMHPEWQAIAGKNDKQIPSDLKGFDRNKDNRISVQELEWYVNDMFIHPEGAKDRLQLLQKAKIYVLEKQ